MLSLQLIRVSRDGVLYNFKTMSELKQFFRCEMSPSTEKKILKSCLTYTISPVTIRYDILVIEEE